MREDIKRLAEGLMQDHSGKTVGLLAGMLVGIAILWFGFFPTLFVLLCGIAGMLLGLRVDQGEDLLAKLQQRLPDRFQRWQ